MKNAQKELLEHVKDREVEFVKVAYQRRYSSEPLLIEGTLEEVLSLLNFDYDYEYGEFFGYVWYTDGIWSNIKI